MGTFTLLYVLKTRTSVLGEAVVVVIVLVVLVVKVGQTYSSHGQPFGQPDWHGHCRMLSW